MKTGICMVTTSYPKTAVDTTAPFIAAMAEGVAARGRRVDVILPAHRQLVAGERAGVHLHPFRYAPLPVLQRWGYAESLAGDVTLRGPALAAAPLALAATLATTAAVTLRRRPLLHAHWVIPNGPPVALVAAVARRPLVISLHGSDVYLAERLRPVRRAARWAFRRAHAVTACSPDLAVRAVLLGADPERVRVVPYGVDVEHFRPDAAARASLRGQLGLGEETPLLLGLGRMVYKKGFGVAIEAVARSRRRDMVLVLAGDGDLRRQLEQQARAAGLAARVRFPGAIGREEVPAWYAAADLFLLPSVHDAAGNVDGLPNVLLEALASGCSVIASDLAGPRMVMGDGAEGVLVPEGDAPALTAAIERLLADGELRRRLGAAARGRAVAELTWDRCVDTLEEIYAGAERRLAGGPA